jgi:hypothetical protein
MSVTLPLRLRAITAPEIAPINARIRYIPSHFDG